MIYYLTKLRKYLLTQFILLLNLLFNPNLKTVALLYASTTGKAESKCGMQIVNSRLSPVSSL